MRVMVGGRLEEPLQWATLEASALPEESDETSEQREVSIVYSILGFMEGRVSHDLVKHCVLDRVWRRQVT